MAAKLSALQLFFALTWVVYVIYLPALAGEAGIDKRFVPWILMMDQAIFIACDWAAGVHADRVASAMKRIGGPMAIATLASCAAFLALPFVAPMAGGAAFVALTAFWSATSSALRAPSMALVSRHVPESGNAWVAGVFLLGMGVASAAAPYLSLTLKGVDPRVPFAIVSVALALFALVLAQAERAHQPEPVEGGSPPGKPVSAARFAAFAVAVLLAATGFQLHFSINSAPAWQRFAAASELPWLMPVFWIGFNLAVLPATLLAKHRGGARVMVGGAASGALVLALLPHAPDFRMLVAAQLLAGAAWAIALTAAFTAALETGRPNREGLFTGVLFSMLAASALARLAATSAGLLDASPYAAALAWAGAAVIVAGLSIGARRSAAGHDVRGIA